MAGKPPVVVSDEQRAALAEPPRVSRRLFGLGQATKACTPQSE